MVVDTYLTVQIISHEDDIIEETAHLRNREPFQIPIRSRGCNRDGFAREQVL